MPAYSEAKVLHEMLVQVRQRAPSVPPHTQSRHRPRRHSARQHHPIGAAPPNLPVGEPTQASVLGPQLGRRRGIHKAAPRTHQESVHAAQRVQRGARVREKCEASVARRLESGPQQRHRGAHDGGIAPPHADPLIDLVPREEGGGRQPSRAPVGHMHIHGGKAAPVSSGLEEVAPQRLGGYATLAQEEKGHPRRSGTCRQAAHCSSESGDRGTPHARVDCYSLLLPRVAQLHETNLLGVKTHDGGKTEQQDGNQLPEIS